MKAHQIVAYLLPVTSLLLHFVSSYYPITLKYDDHGSASIVSTIINGKPSPVRSFFVRIEINRNAGHFCGGAIFEDDWVLTAASCVFAYQARQLTVTIGDSRFPKMMEKYRVMKIHLHDSFTYDQKIPVNNVALLKLDSIIKDYRSKRLTVCREKEAEHSILASCGLGLTSTTELQFPHSLQEALFFETVFKKSASFLPQFCSEDEICVESIPSGANICYFDEGGPLYKLGCDAEPSCLYGIASHALHNKDTPNEMCTAGSSFLRLSYHMAWIESTVVAEDLFSLLDP